MFNCGVKRVRELLGDNNPKPQFNVNLIIQISWIEKILSDIKMR